MDSTQILFNSVGVKERQKMFGTGWQRVRRCSGNLFEIWPSLLIKSQLTFSQFKQVIYSVPFYGNMLN